MLPGVIVPQEGLGSFEEGDRMAIGIPENPQPFAVGCAQTGSEQIKETGLKGRGVKLLHHYPDALWAMGDKSAPNAGFKPSRIFPATEAEAGSDGAGEAVAAAVHRRCGSRSRQREAERLAHRRHRVGGELTTTCACCLPYNGNLKLFCARAH